jgi:isoleucyl-tRNA synthetase
MFEPVPSSPDFPQREADTAQFWREQQIYEKSLELRKDCKRFVFYEGPPTANGMPHPGHCLTRAIKDLFPRYRTMRGYLCERKAGWDTHGLPVEVEVCKELGIHSKEEIEQFGVEPFIHKCQQSVWRYMQEWERLTERLGFWVNLEEAYVTYHQSYVESVWWSLKNLFNRGLLYRGHKIVWWWAQGGTALSAGEVGQGYREVADPSVYVKFPLLDDAGKTTDTSLLVWTTTPWTLPSNQFAAVNPELEYATVVDAESGDKLIIAAELVEKIAEKAKREFSVEATCQGSQLLGRRYVPPFDYYSKTDQEKSGALKTGSEQHVAWRVVAADFVTTDSGSGVVHQAPAFGEVDYDVLVAEQARFAEGEEPQLINAVGPDGKFTADAPDYEGRWVKDCDKDITRDLRERGLLFHQEQYLHDYPFCWRAEEDPLIQYPRESWFIRTTSFKDQMVANNQQVGWQPEHIKDGRFGNFLESNVDWALSRERYWGTPLPIWQCEKTGQYEAIDCYDELLAKPGMTGTEVWAQAKEKDPDLAEDLKVHKPYIDAVTYDSPFADGARMTRVPEVIDCWYDSGAMPFAQWGYPHKNRDKFEEQFPADFISEAIDQTRGWFYSLLAISTMLFGEEDSDDENTTQHQWPHPYRNCIVLGLMLSEWWETKENKEVFLTEDDARASAGKKYSHKVGKMSKQLRNYRSPQEIFDKYGADSLRWYFFANQAPWTSIIYSEKAIKESIPEFRLRMWNVYSFFIIYGNIDGFEPEKFLLGDAGQLSRQDLLSAEHYRPLTERREIDRWILSELHLMLRDVVERMDAYDNYAACMRINEFVDALSNWYVRLCRDRFWASEKDADKWDAYWTLYECIMTLTKAIAPFVPFAAEHAWQTLAADTFGDRVPESVHLCDYPTADKEVIDELLSDQMVLGREVVSLGRSARMAASLKVRQPLSKVLIFVAGDEHVDWLSSHSEAFAAELNVKQIEFGQEPEKYVDYQVLPNFKRLGPRVGKLIPLVKKTLGEADGATLLAELEANGKVVVDLDGTPLELDNDDIEVRLQAKQGWAAAQGKHSVVVLATELTEELIAEGIAREFVRIIQDRRKETGCEFTDRIQVALVTDSAELRAAVEQFVEYIKGETLAIELAFEPIEGIEPAELKVTGELIQLYIKVVANDE